MPDTTDKPASPADHASSADVARRKLLTALKTTDVTIERLDKLMSSAYGQERVFAVTGYLSHALHHLLASAPSIALQTRLGLLARLRHAKTPAAAKPPPATSRLLALSALMSETRYALRLLGLVPLWTWGSATLRNPPKDRVLYALTMLQVVSNMAYQALENGGFLAAKGVVSKKFIDRWGGIDKWYLWSIRAWFGHIFLQFFVLWRQFVLRQRAAAATGEKSAAEKEAEVKAEVRAWRKALVNNVCWAPLCLHWCFEKGIGFPDSLSGVVSFMAGAWGVYDLWAATA
ncbi:hypothetical protein ATEG_10034 [Aspergillus terreus NIH2624]|uniref:Peroxin 11C n=1 Tax=Aspergillus terreus (strain NIH 2624 / FGSC A1156) TaxID=341663 RepID=Q0C8F0_ASPTN|nr:uncharacterized protein ATEG_10034 [Aspergillus terreus NIH2624]EAU29483.1 hypothetical protein ATEG_10034 [Aspergillus terreus NIH2624]